MKRIIDSQEKQARSSDHSWKRYLQVVVIIALCLLGAWLSGELVRQQADLWGAGSERAGFLGRICKASEVLGFGCAKGRKGGWDQIMVPIILPATDFSLSARKVAVPIAFLGLSYFIFMGVWFGMIGGPRVFGNRWQWILLIIGGFGLITSLLLLGAMAFGIAPWCILCLAVHLINCALLIFVGWLVIPGKFAAVNTVAAELTEVPPRRIAAMTISGRQVFNAIAISLAISASLFLYRRERIVLQDVIYDLSSYKAVVASIQQNPDVLVQVYLSQQQHTMPVYREASGTDNRMELIVFTDFECPSCYCKSISLKELAKKYESSLKLSIRHYPLCRACNSKIEREFHENACEAAYVAEAARLLGGDEAFERMHDLLFGNRKQLGREIYIKLAREIGLDAARFRQAMESEEVKQIVKTDIELAHQLGVWGTPFVFLDGRQIPDICEVPLFWKEIAERYRQGDERKLADADSCGNCPDKKKHCPREVAGVTEQ